MAQANQELIELNDMQFDEEYATFDLPFEFEDETVMNGGTHYKLARYKDKIVLAMPTPEQGKLVWSGQVLFEQINLPIVIEMLSDVLEGKLRAPETSRFEYKDDGFKYEADNDFLRIAAQTVWTMPQREAPEQVKLHNFREHKYGALGEQYGMSNNFTPHQARGLLEKLKQISAAKK